MKKNAGKRRIARIGGIILVCLFSLVSWPQRGLSVPLVLTHTSAADFAPGSADGGMMVGVSGGGELVSALEPLAWGSWNMSPSLPVPLQQHAAVRVAERIFVIGGSDGQRARSEVHSAAVTSDGVLSGWSAAGSLPEPLQSPGAAYEGGHLFVVGGFDSSGGARDQVLNARVNPDGSLGSWQVLEARLPRPLADMSLVAANGYLLALGGWDGSAEWTAESTIYRAPVRADGSLGSWSQSAVQLPRALRAHQVVVAGDYLYLIGGSDGTSVQAEVYRAQIGAEGELGSWAQVSTLPVPLRSHAAVAAYGYLHVLGGTTIDDVHPIRSTVYAARLGLDGGLGPWLTNPSGPLPEARMELQAVAAAGSLYMLGGASAFGPSPQTARGGISPAGASGLLGGWSTITASPCQPVSDHGATMVGSYAYVAGGNGVGGVQSLVCSATVEGNGTLGAWRVVEPLPAPLTDLALVSSSGRLYALGGRGAAGITDTVRVATVQADGSLGPWASLSPLPRPLSRHRAAVVRGGLFVLGGHDGAAYQSAVYRAQIQADGSLGPWVEQTALPGGLADYAIGVWGDRIYVIGGQSAGQPLSGAGGPPGRDAVAPGRSADRSRELAAADPSGAQRASRNDSRSAEEDGTPTPTATPTLEPATSTPTATATGTSTASTTAVPPTATRTSTPALLYGRAVYVAILDTDGAVTSWTEASAALPRALAGHAALVAHRYLIVAGGRDGETAGDLSTGFVSAITPDGLLQPWVEVPDLLPEPASGHSLTSFASTAILVGARAGSLRTTVATAPVARGVAEARFSHAFDLGGEYLLTEVQLERVVAGAAEVAVRYRVGDGSGTYGPWSAFSSAPVIPLGSIGRYLQYQIRVRDGVGGYSPVTAVRLSRGANYVKVVDDAGRPVAGATIVRNRKLVTDQDARPLLTNADGMLSVPEMRTGPDGDLLMALVRQHVEPSVRAAHQTADAASGWSYIVFTTSAAVSPDGGLGLVRATAPGEQRLVISDTNTLIAFNLVVSLQWPAFEATEPSAQALMEGYVARLARGLSHASDLLFDATDGQMSLGTISIYDRARHWEDADIQILASNMAVPTSDVGGIFRLENGGVPHTYRTVDHYPGRIRLGRLWDGSSAAAGTWDMSAGYRRLVKSLGAYALGLEDGHYYFNLPDGRRIVSACSGPENRQTPPSGLTASLMDWPYTASELAASGTSLWGPSCAQTRQWQAYGESDWDTLLGLYADGSPQARWMLRTPRERGPNPGPVESPLEVQVLTSVSGTVSGEEERALVVLDGSGTPRSGVQVMVEKAGSGQLLDQGATDAEGRIGLRGADPIDRIIAASWDGELQVSRQIGYVGMLQAAGALWTPRVALTARTTRDRARELSIRVTDVAGAAAAPVARVVDLRGDEAGVVRLTALPAGQYAGAMTLSRPLREGYLILTTYGTAGQSLEHYAGFRVGGIQNAPEWLYPSADPASTDGNLVLHVPAGALPSSALVTVTSAPFLTAAEPGMALLSPVYALQSSVAISQTSEIMNLSIRYRADQIQDASQTRVAIFRYDESNRSWEDLGGDLDEDETLVSTLVRSFGTYAVFATRDGVSSLTVDRFRIRVSASRGDDTFELGDAFNFSDGRVELPVPLPTGVTGSWSRNVGGQLFSGQLRIRLDHIRPMVVSLESFTGQAPGVAPITLNDLGTVAALGTGPQSVTLSRSVDLDGLGLVTFRFQVDVQAH